ncbi:hypothetical protein SAMN05519104_7902 [Rhizobiales bacterium GAS188]|nr:hypothetical protein SAMN05519104_7902 [Rhizobiales bacterium GAS188]
MAKHQGSLTKDTSIIGSRVTSSAGPSIRHPIEGGVAGPGKQRLERLFPLASSERRDSEKIAR